MKVYTLFHGDYSDRFLWGVFDSLEAAKAEHDRRSGYDRFAPREPREPHQGQWSSFEADSWQMQPAERNWACQCQVEPGFGCEFVIEERELLSAQVA